MSATTIAFTSGDVECSGVLRTPEGDGKRSCVVLCTGFGGTQDTPSIVAAAQAFTDAGLATLTFDYRSFGESGGNPRQVIDVSDQLADIHAAVAFARCQPGIDPERIALWGSSLGGGHVVSVAATDTRIGAALAQVPFNGFPRRAPGRSARTTRALVRAMVNDWMRGALRMSPAYIPAVGQPGELAVMTGPEAGRTIATMQSRTWQNRVAPRGLFQLMRYKPGTHAARVRAPLLVCVGENDAETPASSGAALAEAAPRGELQAYAFSHFDIYLAENREAVLADQIRFLDRHLASRTGDEA